ncbi:MAG: hypothetical protein P8K08_16905 [Fuerstiella sp.]|jgi:hypothetical protein|nr:hypothetical protein [Fuerstiella sp.]
MIHNDLTQSPADHMKPELAPSEQRTASAAEVLWLTVFLIFGLFVMSRIGADPDLWGHVTYGKEVLRDGHLHETTTWSYAVDDFRWVNHENIAELIMATSDSFGGQTALLLLKSLLTLVVLGLPVWVARRMGAGLVTCFAIVVLLSFNISFHWLVRPHMLSYACGAGLLAILTVALPGAVTARSAAQMSQKWLWLIPPLMCFWTNAHGGYLAGMAILTAWLGLDGVELLLRRDVRLWPTVRHHAFLFTATVAACLLNPYGYELHTWMLSSLGRPRPEISEWAPLPLFSVDGLPFWCFAFGAFLCLKKTVEPPRWPGLIVMSLLSWQAVRHHRHLPFAVMMGSFVLVPHIESVVRQLHGWLKERAADQHSSRVEERNAGSVAVALVLLVALSCAQFPRQATLCVDRDYYPVSAMQFMADNQLNGKVLVTFNWAQYALAVFADSSPESRIAFDGRFRTCYPQPIIDMYFDFILGDLPRHVRYREDASGPFDATKALDYKSPDLVLIECERRNSVRTMEACSAEWCLLYQDSLAQLWGRRSLYDDPQSERFLPEYRRHRSNDLQHGCVAWPAFPQSGRPASRIELTLRNSGSVGR